MPRSLLPLLAVLVCAATLAYGLGSYPLLQPDEGRNAEIAREMLESGAWLVPTYNGLPYLDKPAFFFKAVALSLGLFGETETAARLPSLAFALGLLWLVHRFCRRHYDAATASVVVMVIAAAPLYIAFSRIVIFDMTLAFFVSATILLCFDAAATPQPARSRLYALAAAAAGLATVVKGPVGFLLPTLVIAVHHAIDRQTHWWRTAFALPNVAIFFAIFLPWFVGVSLQHPDFPYYGIVKESLQRFTTDEFHRSAPIYFYALVIALCFFPWSVLIPESMIAAWRMRRSLRPVDRLFLVWACVVVVFFTLSSSKLPGYILTAVVALGVLVGRVFASAIWHGVQHSSDMVRRGSLALAAAGALAAAVFLWPVFEPTVLSRLPPKTAEHLLPLVPAFGPIAALLAITAALALVAFFRCAPRVGLFAFLLFSVGLVFLAIQHIGPYAGSRSAKELASALPALNDEAELACYMCFPNGLPFYLKRPITVISFKDGREMESNYVRFKLLDNPDWPKTVVRERTITRWIHDSRRPIYLMAIENERDHVRRILGRPTLEFRHLSGDYWGAWISPQSAH